MGSKHSIMMFVLQLGEVAVEAGCCFLCVDLIGSDTTHEDIFDHVRTQK